MPELPIYLDNNATTPCDPEVVEAMLPFFTEQYGNASSHAHYFGWSAEEAVEKARENVAALLGFTAGEIVFTSGATESINLGIRGFLKNRSHLKNHIVTWETEHRAVLDTLASIEAEGSAVTRLPVNQYGLPDLDLLEKSIRPETSLICMMYANNETGMIMPVAAVSEITSTKGIAFFCDATQAVGKIEANLSSLSLVACAAHKFYGPKGVGVLAINKKQNEVKISAMQYGGGHEHGIRSGTLNVPGIVGLGKASQVAAKKRARESVELSVMRNQFLNEILEINQTILNGKLELLLPHVANISFAFPGGDTLLRTISKHIAASSGSACSSASNRPSHVLKAMNLSDSDALASIRFSLGRFTTAQEIDRAIDIIKMAVKKLK
jgi:cysteine desulfurase